MSEFNKNRNHLLQYCLTSVAIFALIDAGLLLFGRAPWHFALAPTDLAWTMAALLLCGLPSSLLHNAAHQNVGGARMNRIVAEMGGTIMLYGFEGFRLGHLFHHRFPDNPKFDPHPPRGYTFPRFAVAPVKATLVVLENAYYDTYGQNPITERNVAWQKRLFRASVALKLVFWLLLLGPKLFVVFYLPLYVANVLVFAHINYATHIDRADGTSEIINLNDRLYYRAINHLTFGGYFHKNHHSRPRAFNPAHVVLSPDRAFITNRSAAVGALACR